MNGMLTLFKTWTWKTGNHCDVRVMGREMLQVKGTWNRGMQGNYKKPYIYSSNSSFMLLLGFLGIHKGMLSVEWEIFVLK